MQGYGTIVTGMGLEPTAMPAANTQLQPAMVRTKHPPYIGARVDRHNYEFQPPHRSGDSAVRMCWDLLVRRCRWLADNTPLIGRMVSLLVQQVVGEGITAYSAAIDHVPLKELQPGALLNHPLFEFGDESDAAWERWACDWADVARQRSLYELQGLSARELFSSGNSLWLACTKKSEKGVAPLCYQLLEAEQLDRSMDRPATRAQNLISHGIEYASDNEPIAYYLFDAHPFDDQAGWSLTGRSRRIPASRVTHMYLPTRASQHFGIPMSQIAMQTAKDADWLVGHELTSAALSAGLTLLIKESDLAPDLDMDTESGGSCGLEDLGVPHVSEIGLGSGTAARVGKDEDVKVIESNRPNPDIAAFVKFLTNQASMGANLSFHRFTGDPSGASFATLRAMINDDRAAVMPLVNYLGRRICRRPRLGHDRYQAAMGKYRTCSAAEYLRGLETYQDFDVLGPPLRNLNPIEDVKAARMRIASGMSTLRIECGLLNLSYRRVLRQLAVERDLASALQLALDFSSGGGGATDRTTTDAAA